MKLQQFITRLLVRFKRIKRAPVEIDEINRHVNQPLPACFDITTPAGEGELIILGVTLSIRDSQSEQYQHSIHAELLCNFSVKVKQSIIYNTHLMLKLEATPNYCKQTKSIGVTNLLITELQLISDQYSIIKDTTNLMATLIPKPIQSIINMTLSTTKALLTNKTISSMTKYLSLYTSGSKQLILDYHRSDIENRVIQLTKDNELSYRLNELVFEEKLFADFGEKIILEEGQLFFVFQ